MSPPWNSPISQVLLETHNDHDNEDLITWQSQCKLIPPHTTVMSQLVFPSNSPRLSPRLSCPIFFHLFASFVVTYDVVFPCLYGWFVFLFKAITYLLPKHGYSRIGFINGWSSEFRRVEHDSETHMLHYQYFQRTLVGTILIAYSLQCKLKILLFPLLLFPMFICHLYYKLLICMISTAGDSL